MRIRFARIMALFLAVVLVIILSPDQTPSQIVHAQAGVQARVTPDNLNVRATPGEDAPLIDRFLRDTILVIEGREDLQGNGGIWVFASPVNGGTRGWVISTFLEFPSGFVVESLPVISVEGVAAAGAEGTTPAPADAPAGSLSAVTKGPVNFRSGPGRNFSVINTLTAGVTVAVTGRSADNTWFKAVVNGQEGWLFYTLITLSGDRNALPVVEGTVAEAAAPGTTTSGPVTAGAPGYSAANLSVFSYGAHIQSFNYANLMHSSGMTWAKKQIRYSWGQDPASVAGTIAEAHALGFRILLGVVGSPGEVAAGGDSYFQSYASFVGGLAALGADAIEIWNEPNLDREWPNGQIDPARYTQLLALSYNNIKANNPGTIVISAALAPTGAEGLFGLAAVWNDNRFLAGMRAAGAGSYMDCLGAHYNEGIVSPTQTSGDPRGDNYYTRYFWGMVNTYRSLLPGKPICFTELGYLTPEGFGSLSSFFAWASNTSLAEQTLWLDQVISIARGSGSVKLVIIWNLDFQGTSGGYDPQGGYAMIRPDGSCPACAALAQ